METIDYKKLWDNAMSYSSYRELIDRLIKEGKTTGTDQSQSLIDYTALNAQRMKRIDKTYHPNQALIETLSKLKGKVLVMTITESWCGDAAQIVPVASALLDQVGIPSRLVLRDENLDLIDQHLTNGGRSIPIVMVLDAKSLNVISTWGPRPAEVQKMVMDYKSLPEPKSPYSEFSKQVQLWYAKNKYQSIERELSELLVQNIG